MKRYAIILAGGMGERMREKLPKQFMLLEGKPLLMYAVKAFHSYAKDVQMIVVLPKSLFGQWRSLCMEHDFSIPHELVAGGSNRFFSVKNGLAFIFEKENDLEDTLIAIHDGARPLVSKALIEKTFSVAKKKKTAVSALLSADSIRIKKGEKTHSFPREKVYLVQTPQVFDAELLKTAFDQAYHKEFTDDASVVEKGGHPIHLVDGDIHNIKVTYLSDLALAAYWLTLSRTPDQSK